jgi:hypothetical protein
MKRDILLPGALPQAIDVGALQAPAAEDNPVLPPPMVAIKVVEKSR